jgi:threonylcarbamoyladenosine tRNA methylthiotransferase MtaB
MSLAYRENLIGSTQEVLFEEAQNGFFTGHAPNYVKVYAPGQDLHNQVKSVRITGLMAEGVVGELI